MEPKGEKTLIEVKALLEEQINECKEILKEIPNGEGILYKTTMTVNELGKIVVYQYIYFLCQHAKRHITQMQGLKEEFSRFKGIDSTLGPADEFGGARAARHIDPPKI